jgi:hypothetical protein
MRSHKGLLLGAAALTAALYSVGATATGSHLVPPGYDCRDCGAAYGVSAPVPPRGFDPVAASDEELAFFGFPPRPDASKNPHDYANWKSAVTLPSRRIDAQMQLTRIMHGPARDVSVLEQPSTPGPTGGTSTNWGGYSIVDGNNPFNQAKTYVYGIFVVPFPTQAVNTCNGTWDYSSPWVGFDGTGSSGDVLQAGMDIDAYCSGSTTSQTYAAWYEWFPAGSVYLKNFPITAGDVIYVYVWPSSSTKGNYYIANVTQNFSSGGSFNAPSGTSLVGNSVEWIDEWFQGPMVTNYWDVAMNDVRAALPNGTQYSPAKAPTGTVYSITLIDSSGDQLSKTYMTPNNAMTYTDPSGKVHTDTGTTLWFQTEGIAK